jgi:hypothetical protein
MRPTTARLSDMPGRKYTSIPASANQKISLRADSQGLREPYFSRTRVPLIPIASPFVCRTYGGETKAGLSRRVSHHTVRQLRCSFSVWSSTPSGLALSPFRQRGSAHLLRSYLFNGYRRLAAQTPYWIIPFACGTFALLPFGPC